MELFAMRGVIRGKHKLAYTVKEALELLPFKRNKFYDEVKEGRLLIKKIGSKTIVTHEDLLAYIRSLPSN
jgi:hypothetical protein